MNNLIRSTSTLSSLVLRCPPIAKQCACPCTPTYQRCLSTTTSSHPSSSRARVVTAAAAAAAAGDMAGSDNGQQRVRLAVVGDVHGQWSAADAAALQFLEADAVLWVGDIGNEDVALVEQIASLDVEKAVILGNHDSWFSLTDRGRQRAAAQHSPTRSGSLQPGLQQPPPLPPQPPPADRVQQQLDALGSDHVGYGHKELRCGTNAISVVGARPFTKGGKSFSDIAQFMSRFGVSDMQESAAKVLEVINTQVPAGNSLILLAHNGPTGLGGEPHSICGVDWLSGAGDHGDPDLQQVLQQLQQQGRRVALVLHGHMHHTIKGGGWRQMVQVDPAAGTVYLNAATVPRVVTLPHSRGPAAASRHHFLVVELEDGVPCCAADVWVQTSSSSRDSSSSQDPAVAAQRRSFLASAASAMHAVQHSKSKSKTQKQATAVATTEEVRRRLQLQAPKQLSLQQQSQQQSQQQEGADVQVATIGGYQVQIAEVHEVLRSLQAAADAAEAAAADGNGASSSSSSTSRRWQYFDAHTGRWVTPAAAAAAAAEQAGAASSAQAAVSSGAS